MTKKIYQLQIALEGFKPKIWRRILLPSDTLLSDFHYVIQIFMGWHNSHLHQFIVDGKHYAEKMDGDEMWDELGNIDYEGVRLDEVLKTENSLIQYEYDFGDGWMHEILLEKILPFDTAIYLPTCLNGSMNCPVEDSGGVHGYAEYLRIRQNPDHEEYESVIEWLGEDFDPDYFNVDEKNAWFIQTEEDEFDSGE